MPKEIYPTTAYELNSHRSRVSLILRSEGPYVPSNSVANQADVIAGQAGRTCYSSEIQFPVDYEDRSDRYRAVTDAVVKSTREAGHLTTRQHVHYTFALENVSRLAMNFLHAHPHYNSEEMSQRYVSQKDSNPLTIDFGTSEMNMIASESIDALRDSYQELTSLLTPTTRNLIVARFPGRSSEKWQGFIDKEAQKKAQEVGRYLLPLGSPTNLYHTVSELTLIRLYHLSKTFPAQPELSQLINSMIDTVVQVDPSILSEIGAPIEPTNRNLSELPGFDDTFDEIIQSEAAILDQPGEIGIRLARAVKLTLGKNMPDSEAIALILDPTKYPLIASVWGEPVLDQLGVCLNQAHLSAIVSLSHTANYQLHRHRGFSHTEPLNLSVNGVGDLVTPNLLLQNQEALDLYLSTLERHTQALNNLTQHGATQESLQYLLPNATRVRKTISGPLGSFVHFIKTRTCLNAQEEIYSIAVSLAQQISQADPLLASHFDKTAPCGVRQKAGITPYCPEGSRFCGVKIWNFDVTDYPKRDI